MKLKYILIFIISLTISLSVKSQKTIKSFTDDPITFIDELKTFFQEIDSPNDKKIAKDFFDDFLINWNNGKFSDSRKKQIIATCNKMIKKKMKPIPQFKEYLSAVTSITNSIQTDDSYKAWEASLDKLINRSTSALYMEYLEMSNGLFTSNVLFKSQTTQWKSDNNKYTFLFDSIPRIVFPSLKLSCYANNDSSVIINTKGTYLPTQNKWIGKGGKITWKRTGLSTDSVYAEINNYTIIFKYSKYSIDSVNFYNKNYFTSPLLGRFEDKLLANHEQDKVSYPRFESYDKRLKIQNVFPDIDYDGGFTMDGSKLMGAGDAERNAILIFYREGKKFMKTEAKTYIIRKDKISSESVSLNIYWDNDSIYHPDLQMKYLNAKKELSFLRGTEGHTETPFTDTYHKIDMYVESLIWKMDQPLIDMKMIKGVGSESQALYESDNYYSADRYYKIQGIDETNPLSDLRKFAKTKNSKVISVPEYASHIKIELSQVQALMIKMANMGFISYDTKNDKVYLKGKLENFLLSRAGKVDYDVIQFNSLTYDGNSAEINLLDFNIKIHGVSSIYLSDSQNVYIYPRGEDVLVKKNRDFDFDGRVHSGLFDFYGKLFSFLYDKFKIEMPVVDSMSFKVKSFAPDENGKKYLVRVKSVIEGIKGDVQIDDPNNKSGVKHFPRYPTFTSYKDSYVYYNRKQICGGVYSRDKFYFHIVPFTVDSLANSSTQGIKFAGEFSSASIFPDIKDTLRVQPDYSLGFSRLAPPGGYPVYGGKGVFDSIMNISNEGLRGNGSLKYLTSLSRSNKFMFYPDSMNAKVQKYTITEQKSGIEYPTVVGENVYERWKPYEDVMFVSDIDKPIAMYDLNARIHGGLALTPKGLTGHGTIKFNNAELDAKLFKFKNRVFDADTSDFRLKSYDLSELAFSTYNYKAHVDFDKKMGEFKSNGGGSKVEFPINMYICFMDEFDWYMDKEEIDVANSQGSADLNKKTIQELADIDISGSEFVSIHPSQDSLRFFAQRAKYSLKDNIIYAKEVKIIKVADAAIYPDNGDVTILKKAEMKPLINAKILANVTTKYHVIYNATVNINSKKNYNASGMYDYVDETGTKFPFFLSKIGVDTSLQSWGSGFIPDSAKFRISPNFDFTGTLKFVANNEFLNFDGAFNINHFCGNAAKPWVKFKSDINPNEIYIPVVDSLRDISNGKLEAGILMANDSGKAYTAFLSRKLNYSDQGIIRSKGFIFYDKISDEYRISSKEKIKQLSQPGNYLSLTRNSCLIYGDGKIDLAPNMGRVTLKSYGNIKHYMIPDTVSLDLVMLMDFFFNDDAFKLIEQDLAKYTTLQAVDLSRLTFTKSLAEILGTKEADKNASEIQMNGAFKKIPTELQHTFFFGDVQMKYDKENKWFASTGPIGIVALGKNQVNKYVNGFITIKKSRSGDEMNLYIEFSSSDWYFFNYKSGVMQAVSSSKEFNNAIMNTKPDNRQLKVENNLPAYQYTIAPESKKKSFLKKIDPNN